jgi:protoporphyrinogen oxidase
VAASEGGLAYPGVAALISDDTYDFVVLGGGLAGLTFAVEATRLGRKVAVLERESQVGGLARTLCFGDFRFDIGGHRFHSRWPEVSQWVMELLGGDACEVRRRSRIRLDGTYIDYPLRFPNALAAFSPLQALAIFASYLRAALFSSRRRPAASFEEWIVRRFGRRLFDIYFRPYTEKVWGLPCDRISAEWANQRIRLPSLRSAVVDSVRRRLGTRSPLVSRFSYPSLGIGVLSERMAEATASTGRGVVRVGSRVVEVSPDGSGWRVTFRRDGDGGEESVAGAEIVSTLPLSELFAMLPRPGREAGELLTGLGYRSLICVFLAVEGPRISDDTWTYFPDRSVLLGRTHEPANWSPRMAPVGSTSLCVEVFCSEGDESWRRPDGEFIELVLADLDRLRFLDRGRVRQAWLLRAPHAYPVYEIGYAERLACARATLGRWPMLHCLGRTGSFQYLNMDAVIRDGLQLARTLCPPR